MGETTTARPDRIWLQDGCVCSGIPGGDCGCQTEAIYDAEVTWCRDQIHDSDSEYLRATPERKAAPQMLEALLEAYPLAVAWSVNYRIMHNLAEPHETHARIVEQVLAAITAATKDNG